jgi:hypothetical protein
LSRVSFVLTPLSAFFLEESIRTSTQKSAEIRKI